MNYIVGMPRALLYYKQFPFWKSFFKSLGAKVVLSEQTNKDILNLGLDAAPSEICLPVKIFFGHALSLADSCDYVFVPRIVSIEKSAYTCPKLMGLPDMIKALPNAPEILTATFNAKEKKPSFQASLKTLAEPFSKNLFAVRRAHKQAEKSLEKFNKGKLAGNLTNDLLDERTTKETKEPKLTVGIVGHPYNIYDPYISLNFIERLKKQDIEIKTLENIEREKIEKQTKTIDKEIFWTYEKEVVGTVMHWLRNKEVDGIIYVLAFACGPDSLMQVMIEEEARKCPDTPVMSIVIDEHSGKAGILTRLEAFVDMLEHRKNREKVLS